MNREADNTMETNFSSRHATPIKRFPLDRSECGLPIRTSTPISNTNPDVDAARKDSNGHDSSFRRLRATVLFDNSDGSQIMVSYDAPAPQMECSAYGRPGELSVTQVAALATHGPNVESNQQHRASFIARGSVQPSKASSSDSFLQPPQETCGEFQQQQEPSLTRRGSCGDAFQLPETMVFTSASSREAITDLEKPGLGGRSMRMSDGVSQQDRPSVPRSGSARRGKLPQYMTTGLLRTEVGNARNLTSGASKVQAKDEKTQLPGKPNFRSKDKTDPVSRETVNRGNTFTIKSPHSDGLAKKPLGRNPSIAVAAKPKLVSECGSAAKSRFTRSNIPQLPVLKGQRLSKRLSDIGTRKTEAAESIRTRSRSTSRVAVELASSAIHQSTPQCIFRSYKDAMGSAFSASKGAGSVKLEHGKSAPVRLKAKLATRDLSKVVQTSKRMPPILKVPSPSLKRTLSTSKETPNLMDAYEITNNTPKDVAFDRNSIKDLFLKSNWKSKLEEPRSEEDECHKNSIQYRTSSVESALTVDAPLQPLHSHQPHDSHRHPQQQTESHELRCSMSAVEEEEASLAILSSPIPCDSGRRETEVTVRPLSVAGGELRKQWNVKWSDESFELKVALNLSRHVNNLLTQLQQKVSDPDVVELCLGRYARSSLPRYRSDNQDMHGLLENLRSSEKKIKSLLEVVEVWSSYNRDVA